MATIDVGLDVLLSTWTSAKAYLRNAAGVRITTGRPDLKSTLSPAACVMTLDNRDNRWTIRNPTGAWYGQLVQNTPVRVSVPSSLAGLPCYLRLESDTASYFSTADSAPLQITTGILSLRVDCKITDWAGNHVLLAKWGATAHAWALWTNGDGTIQFAYNNGSTDFSNKSPLPVPYFGQRIAIRVDYNIGAGTVAFFTARTMAGTWTPLGPVEINPGPVSQTAGAGQIVQVGAGTTNLPGTFGEIYEAQVVSTPGIVAGNISGSPAGTPSTATGGAALTITWASNPVAGQKVIVAFQTGNTVSTVKDNGTSVSTFTLVKSQSDGTHTVYVYEADAISLPGAGSYAVTVTFSAGALSATGYGRAYSGVATGTGTVTSNSGTGTSVSTTGVSGSAGNLYFAAFCDESGLNPETISLTSAGFTTVSSQTNGSSFVPGAAADFINPASSGGTSATWTLGDSVAWAAVIATWASAATVTTAADPVFTAQTPGASSFTDAQSNTWTAAGTAELSGRFYRFHGELAALPKAAAPNSAGAYTQAQAGGLMRRLTLRQTPADSAMKRAYVRLPSNLKLAAYWPAEDGATATQIGQAVGKFAMTSAGLTMAASTAFACSAALPVMNNSTATALVDPNSVTWTDNTVRTLLAVPQAGETSGANVIQFSCSNSPVGKVVVQYQNQFGGTLQGFVFSPSGTQLVNTGAINTFSLNGALTRVSAALVQNGGNIDLHLAVAYVGSATAQTFTAASVAAGTNGAVTSVSFGGPGLQNTAMGHFSVQGADDPIFDVGQPLNAWSGETAGNRFSRLCGEEGIACRIIGPPSTSQPMGFQTQQTIAALLQEIENTDQGLMFEPRFTLGLGYVTNRGLCNQAVVATGDFAQRHVDLPFSPASDDTLVVNDATATAADGSTARYVLPTGAQSVQAPPAGAGRFDTTITVNPQYDSQLTSLASWYVHTRTADEDRYPAIPFQLARGNIPQSVLLLDIGSYLQVVNPPSWVPPGPVKQIVAGYTETLGPQPSWQITFNGIPESPYEIAILGDPVLGHLDTAGSATAGPFNTSATSISINTTVAPIWTTNAGDFPFDILIAGEQMTVTNITGAGFTQTFTVTRSVNGVVKSHVAGETVRLAHPMILAL